MNGYIKLGAIMHAVYCYRTIVGMILENNEL